MPANQTNKRNIIIAIVVCIIGVLLLIGLTLWVLFAPKSALEVVDTANIKLILLGLIFVGICLVGIFTYSYFYTPTVKRAAHTSLMLAKFLTTTTTGFSFIVLPRIQALNVSPAGGMKASFSALEYGSGGVLTFLIGMISIILLNHQYKSIGEFEALNKVEI